MAWYFIVAISLAAFIIFCFFVYLFLVAPGKNRPEMKKFKSVRFAHRGLHGDGRAENSLSAFRAAVDAGYGIELDVRLSSDGELVVFHDESLERVTGVPGLVCEKSAEELSKIKLSATDDTVPTFLEVLRLVDGRVPLLVEIKESPGRNDVTGKTIELLKKYSGAFIIESFNPISLSMIRKEMPDVLRGFLSTAFLKEEKYRGQMKFFLLQNLLFNFLCRPDFISYDHAAYKNFSLRFVRRVFKTTTICWTVTSREDEKLAYEHGFDGVIFENYIPEEKR